MRAELKEDPFSNCAPQSLCCLLSASKQRESVMNLRDHWRDDDKVNSGGIKEQKERSPLPSQVVHSLKRTESEKQAFWNIFYKTNTH